MSQLRSFIGAVALFFVFALATESQARPDKSSQDTQGPQKTAVVMLNTSGLPSTSLPTAQEVRDAIFDGPFSLNTFYQEVSRGQVEFAGEVWDWWDLPQYQQQCFLDDKQLMQLLGEKINLRKFQRYIVFYSVDQTVCQGRGLGHSTHGKAWHDTPYGPLWISVSVIGMDHILARPKLPYQRLSGLASGVLVHEMGHALGIRGHANIFHCGEKVFSAVEGECQQSAIADMFSVMGGEGFYRPAVSLNACHRQSLGWIDAPELQTFTLDDIERTPREIQIYPTLTARKNQTTAVRIDLAQPIVVTENVAISSLFLEYKTADGMDRRLSDLRDQADSLYKNIEFANRDFKEGPNKINIEGLQIRGGFFRQGNCITTYLFDAKPGSVRWQDQRYDLYDSLDGFLTSGQVVVEPLNGLRIQNMRTENGSTWVLISKKSRRPALSLRILENNC